MNEAPWWNHHPTSAPTISATTTTVIWTPVRYGQPDDDGLAGVGEPRRPLPDPSNLHATADQT